MLQSATAMKLPPSGMDKEPPLVLPSPPAQTSQGNAVIQHLRRFCETTSVRGVPKIVHSRRPRQRCLWIAFVTAFFVGCTTCVTLLVNQYRAFDVIHQPRTLLNSSVHFPSFSFCNLRPFSSRFIDLARQRNISMLPTFLKKLKDNIFKFKRILNDNKKLYVALSSVDISTFLLNLPPDLDLNSVGHSRHGMVIGCIVVYQSGLDLNGIRCDEAGRWVLTRNELYLNCYTFIVNKKFSLKTRGVEITLYTDDIFDFDCSDCKLGKFPSTQMTGVRFTLQMAETYPDILNEGFVLSPGTFTDALFITRKQNMMEPPYGKCNLRIDGQNYEIDNNIYRYSRFSCNAFLRQQKISRDCGCVKFVCVPQNLSHRVLPEKRVCSFVELSVLRNSNQNISHQNMDRLINHTQCDRLVTNNFKDDFTKCPVLCNYYTFEARISSGIYPTKSQHLAFQRRTRDTIKKVLHYSKNLTENDRKDLHRIIDKLSVYDRIRSMVEETNNMTDRNQSETIRKTAESLLRATDIIEKNFLTINVNRPDFNVIQVEEKAVISLTSFLSQVGGMFSIWSGITFICVVEIIELFLNVFDTIISPRYNS